MVSPSRSPLLFSSLLLLLNLFHPVISAKNTSFDFPSFSIRNLTLLGDSYLRNGSIGLTRETGVPSSSSGTGIYNLPVQFYDPATRASASFSTKFSFSIANLNPASYGDGLTFFISPDNSTFGSTGGYLGLFNSSAPAIKNWSVLALEFDTWLDPGLDDPSENHVGLDIDGPISVMTADLEPYGIILKSGNLITAWIDYYDDESRLKVWLGYSSGKPEIPVLSTRFNLSKYFKEYMYVGFSASTEGSTEVHTVESWSFRTFGFPTLNLSPYVPYNKSVSSWSAIPAIPIARSYNSSHKKLTLGLAIMAPLAFGMVFVVFLLVSIKKWKERNRDNDVFDQDLLKGPRRFSYKELSAATRGFHSSRIVGNGAFGTVYRAVHPGSSVPYAVKRSKHAHQGKSEFIAELSIIGCLRHKNLVQLEGWCCEKGELLLVYEFMPNGCLDRALYRGPGSGSCSTLKWSQRYNVAVGIASILTYLHQECEKQVIHRDIKTSNIMLDADFNPRLGDFGLARLMDHNKSPLSTLTAGTMGYLAPEYLQYGKATEKTDVFSYGVVILEVCCGRRPIDKEDGKDQTSVNLVDWVWGFYSHDKLIEAADRRLNGEFDKEEMLRLLLVGLSCANPNCAERPSMRRVLQILKSEAEPIAVPKTKPLLMFTTSASLSLQEIVSDCDETAVSSPLYELKIN